MLRRLEKGLNTAKLKQNDSSLSTVFPADPRTPQSETSQFGALRQPDAYGSVDGYATSSVSSRTIDQEDEDDGERSDEKFPAKLIKRENSFFRTILNPEHKSPMPHASNVTQSLRPAALPHDCNDPITAGLIDEHKAKVLFDLIFLRLNPFINLFDPTLHSVAYVRSKCPLLFTTLIMAGCKFFEPSLYKECLRLAHELAIRAFAENWKRVEVVQAFACLTYWREQDDNRTWMYIGYACRMAVELGLNRYVAKPPAHESDFQLRERRNKERTYLVLFVHDRSLSMQTGRHWMLPEDDFIRHSDTWHEHGGSPARCEDVVVSAFAQLRRIATEATDMFHTNRSSLAADGGNSQVNIDMVLKNCNAKLAQWNVTWEHEMRMANGESFHFSFINFFCLYSRLFLNSFGVQSSVLPANRTNTHVRALSACFENALDVLRISSKDFREFGVLRYGQETTSVMTAYSAIFLLKLLRSSNTHTDLQSELPEGAAPQIHVAITKTAEAYQEASHLSPTSSSAAYHSRFLLSLVRADIERTRQAPVKEVPIDPSIQQSSYAPPPPCIPQQFTYPSSPTSLAYSGYTQAPSDMNGPNGPQGYVDALGRGSSSYGPSSQIPGYNMPHASDPDFHYYRSMLVELGWGVDGNTLPSNDGFRNIAYGDTAGAYAQHPYVQPMSQSGFGAS